MDLSIIIVNWNSREYLERCIASILANTRTLSFEIIVIDSGSFDGCEQMLRESYPQVRFIQSASNLGFARSNNQAFEQSAGECVLFLNPDTELTGPAIERLWRSLNSLPDAGIVGCKLLNSNGTVQTSCVQSMPTILNKTLDSEFLRSRWPKCSLWGTAALFERADQPQEVEAISGACMMLKRSTFKHVGGFSEDYFMYAEDIDLAYKVRRAGYRHYVLVDTTVVHHGGASSGKTASAFTAVMMREATWRFLRKTRGGPYAFAFRVCMLLSAIGRVCVTAMTSPVTSISQSGSRAGSSARKWLAVLRWTVGLDHVVGRFYSGHVQPPAFGAAPESTGQPGQ